MKNTFILLTITLFTFSFSSCSDDESTPEPTVDIRDQIIGTYTYDQYIEFYDGSTGSHQGTVKVEKGTTNNKIIFFEDGNIVIKGTKLKDLSNAVAFDIEDMSETDDEGYLYEYKGIDGFESNDGVKYHGGFEKETNKVHLYYETYIDGEYAAGVYFEMSKI
ncbi:MAG: hypothetical protein P8P81_02435 [Bacteroidia bacterium]|nr:hypothetical protein [Bacteroidia bacterium]